MYKVKTYVNNIEVGEYEASMWDTVISYVRGFLRGRYDILETPPDAIARTLKGRRVLQVFQDRDHSGVYVVVMGTGR